MSTCQPHPPTNLPTAGSWMQGIRWQLWLQRRPFLVYALAGCLGIWMADAGRRPLLEILAAITAGVVLVRHRGRAAWILPVFLACHWRHEASLALAQGNPVRLRLEQQADQRALVTVRGRLLPVERGNLGTRQPVTCDLTAVSWGADGGFVPASGRIDALLPERFPLSRPGLHELTGVLHLPAPPANPGEFDVPAHHLRNGLAASMLVSKAVLLKEEGWAPAFRARRVAEACRAWIAGALGAGLEESPDERSVLLAMALGAADTAGERVKSAFRRSGTLHVFAVSGLHVALLAGVLTLGLRLLGIGPSKGCLILVCGVFFYAFITGWRPSAARAAFMIAACLLAVLWNRRADVQNSLGLAALLILGLDTQQLYQAGFQLSFMVLWAITLLAPPLLRLAEPWTRHDPFLPPSLVPWPLALRLGCCRFIAGLCCTSAAAWVGSLPLMLGHFRTATPAGLLANTVLVPASSASMGLSCLALVSAGCGLGGAQRWINQLNGGVAGAMIRLAEGFAGLPGASFTLDLRFRRDAPLMELHVLSLRDGGAAAFLRTRESRWLIDCGSLKEWPRVVEPFLRHEGVNTLDGLLLTHGDSRHVGAARLARGLGSPRVHTSVLEPWPRDSRLAAMRQLALEVPVDSMDWHRHQAGAVIQLGGGARAEVLHPLEFDRENRADDRALVLLLHLAGTRVLMLSDAGFTTLHHVLERHPALRCDVIVRSHHQADNSGLEDVVAATGARAVISGNDWRAPEAALPQDLRDHCRARQIRLADLMLDGCASLDVHEGGALLRTFRDGKAVDLPAPQAVGGQ